MKNIEEIKETLKEQKQALKEMEENESEDDIAYGNPEKNNIIGWIEGIEYCLKTLNELD